MLEDEPSAEDLLIKPFDYHAVIQQQLGEIERLKGEIASKDAELVRLKALEGRIKELEEENDELQDCLDKIADIAAPPETEEFDWTGYCQCPVCLAEPDEPCLNMRRGSEGMILDSPHEKRRKRTLLPRGD